MSISGSHSLSVFEPQNPCIHCITQKNKLKEGNVGNVLVVKRGCGWQIYFPSSRQKKSSMSSAMLIEKIKDSAIKQT